MAGAPAGYTEVSEVPEGYTRVTAAPPAKALFPSSRSLARDVGQIAKDAAYQTFVHVPKMVAGFDDPQNAADYAILAAAHAPLIAAGGAGVGALATRAGLSLPKLAPAVGRVAAMGALEKERGVVQGKDSSPWLTMGVGGVFEGVGPLARVAASKFAKPAAEVTERLAEDLARHSRETAGAATAATGARTHNAMREAVRGAEVRRVGKDIGTALPELETATDAELFGAAHEWGRAQMNRVMASGVNEIRSRVASVTPTRWMSIPEISKTPVSFDEAMAEFSTSKARGAIGRQIGTELRRLDEAVAQHTGSSPGTGALFADTMKARNAARTYLAVIAKGLDKDGVLDPNKVRAYVNKHGDKLASYAGDYWPRIKQALVGTSETGAVPSTMLPKGVEIPDLGVAPVKAVTPASVLSRVAERVKTTPITPEAQAAIDAMAGVPVGGAPLGLFAPVIAAENISGLGTHLLHAVTR